MQSVPFKNIRCRFVCSEPVLTRVYINVLNRSYNQCTEVRCWVSICSPKPDCLRVYISIQSISQATRLQRFFWREQSWIWDLNCCPGTAKWTVGPNRQRRQTPSPHNFFHFLLNPSSERSKKKDAFWVAWKYVWNVPFPHCSSTPERSPCFQISHYIIMKHILVLRISWGRPFAWQVIAHSVVCVLFKIIHILHAGNRGLSLGIRSGLGLVCGIFSFTSTHLPSRPVLEIHEHPTSMAKELPDMCLEIWVTGKKGGKKKGVGRDRVGIWPERLFL